MEPDVRAGTPHVASPPGGIDVVIGVDGGGTKTVAVLADESGSELARATGQGTNLQTVGGTGALRTLADLIASAHPDATVWTSNPGYANHHPLMCAAGLLTAEYPWQDDGTGHTDLRPILEALGHAQPGDILLVQGCCHNPTGLDLTEESWHALAQHCQARGLIPLVDMAYQGLGQGDRKSTRLNSSHRT